MRVLHVAEGFGGGLYEVVRTLTNRLAADGHEMVVAYGRRPETPEAVAEGFDSGASLVPLPWDRRSAFAQLTAARELRRVARGVDPDVIHLHSSFAGTVGPLALSRRTPIVYTPHAYPFTRATASPSRRAAYRIIERMVARSVSVVAATSNDEATLARKVLRAPRVDAIPTASPNPMRDALPRVLP